jgi:hypothetical protein
MQTSNYKNVFQLKTVKLIFNLKIIKDIFAGLLTPAKNVSGTDCN